MGQSAQIKEDARIGGNANMIETSAIVGHLTTASRIGPGVPGRQTIDPSIDGAKPEFPNGIKPVSPWVDYAFDRAQWRDFAYFNMDGPCNVAKTQGAINKMSIDSPGPSILNTRNCLEDVSLWGAGMTLPNDVALVLGKRSYMSGAGPAIGNNSEPRKLWLIQPDDTKDEQPSCPAGGGGHYSAEMGDRISIRDLDAAN